MEVVDSSSSGSSTLAPVVKATPSGESTDRTRDADPELEEVGVEFRVELKVGKRGGMERFRKDFLGCLTHPLRQKEN